MDIYNKLYFSGLEKAQVSEIPRNLRTLKNIEEFKKKGKILDVGVGTGLFLYLANSHGWEIFGLDISKYAIKNLKKNLAGKFFAGSLEQNPFKNNFFDVINLRHTLEHIENPENFLKKCWEMLKPEGIICISVPNSFGIHAKIYGKSWSHLSLPYHKQFYSKKSLSFKVKKAGFKILEVKTEEITIDDVIKFLIFRLGFQTSYQNPMKISRILDKILARLGFGEGLVLIAKKLK